MLPTILEDETSSMIFRYSGKSDKRKTFLKSKINTDRLVDKADKISTRPEKMQIPSALKNYREKKKNPVDDFEYLSEFPSVTNVLSRIKQNFESPTRNSSIDTFSEILNQSSPKTYERASSAEKATRYLSLEPYSAHVRMPKSVRGPRVSPPLEWRRGSPISFHRTSHRSSTSRNIIKLQCI